MKRIGLIVLSCLAAGALRAQAPTPKPGEPVDLSAWAYAYRKDSPSNPPETQWLWPHQTLRWDWINGSLAWYYDDSSDVLPRGEVLAALLWEEPRDVQTVTVEFPAGGHVPGIGQVLIAARSSASPWEDSERKAPYTAVVAEEQGHPKQTQRGTTLFRFNLVAEPTTKLYALYTGNDASVAPPVIHAYSKARWAPEAAVEIENGSGRVEAYNGVIAGTEPFAAPGGGSRGLRVRVFATDQTGNSRTLVTFHGGTADFTVALREIQAGPVSIPGAGALLQMEGGGATAAAFARDQAAAGRRTEREKAELAPEESWRRAMTRYHGDRLFPDFPAPPYEPPMKIDVPERPLVRQWNLGAWHLRRWSQRQPDGSYAVSIWPYDKSIGGNEGMVALGSETYLNLIALDMLGVHDVAEGGLDYWLFGPHARPFLWDAEVMGGDALINADNSPNRKSPGYDQKHSIGHGRIMAAAAFHYRITRDDTWWRRAAPVLERAAAATLRLRDAWDATQPPGTWSHGLIPPGNISDNNNNRLFYGVSAYYYKGLNDVAALLADTQVAGGTELVRRAAAFRADLRAAVDRSLALTQVVKVGDGAYRRDFSFMPYIRGLALDIDSGPVTKSSRYYESKIGALSLVDAGVIAPTEPVVSDLLDVYEDRLVQDGQNDQNGYNIAPDIYLARDDIPMFLRGFYNGYAAEIDPDAGYTFWEAGHPGALDALDKTFEEAGFLRKLRQMLVMEDGDVLWLARGTPRAWLEQGNRIAIAHAPTFFGESSYTIVSDVAHGRIGATVDLPDRPLPRLVNLRLRHPSGARITRVLVNARPWPDFDPARETITLHGLSGVVSVEAFYE